jgi:hypothetical protein
LPSGDRTVPGRMHVINKNSIKNYSIKRVHL